MTAEEFKAAQATLGYTNPQMADLLCCTVSLVEKMRKGTRGVSRKRAEKLRGEVGQCRVGGIKS